MFVMFLNLYIYLNALESVLLVYRNFHDDCLSSTECVTSTISYLYRISNHESHSPDDYDMLRI